MKIIKLFTVLFIMALAVPATAQQVKVLGKSGTTSTATAKKSTAAKSTTQKAKPVAKASSASNGSQYENEGLSSGVEFAYAGKMEAFGLGVRLLYGINENIRLDLSDHYYFKKEYKYLDDLNLNVHYLFDVADNLQLYPLAGVTLLLWKVEFDDYNFQTDTWFKNSFSDSKFGVNLGGGAQYALTDQLMLNGEVKFQLISDTNQLVLSAGLIYKF
ncbi:MAG: porin family protein [Prevotella sp.]|jgi:outer membrane protein X|nr:porin family protein [Prevotella sp.]